MVGNQDLTPQRELGFGYEASGGGGGGGRWVGVQCQTSVESPEPSGESALLITAAAAATEEEAAAALNNVWKQDPQQGGSTFN